MVIKPVLKDNIMDWRPFWEQFEVSLLTKPHLSDRDKLAYLWHAFEDGPARYAVECLSRMSNVYL